MTVHYDGGDLFVRVGEMESGYVRTLVLCTLLVSGSIVDCSLNFEKECQRLCDGFLTSLENLRIGQTISDMLGVAKPEWEKSPGLVVGRWQFV